MTHMRHKKKKSFRRKLNIIKTCIKVTFKKIISYANENKMVYVIAVTTLALIVTLALIIAKSRGNDAKEEVIEEVVQVGVDDEGKPVYETKKVVVKKDSSKTEETEEITDDPTILAYKEDAKNGYMNNCVFLGDSRTVAAVSYGFLNDDKVLAQIGIAHTSVASYTFTQNSGKQYTLSSFLKSHQSPVVYINYGVNGMYGTSEEKYTSTYEELIDQIIGLCPNSKIVLMGIWPVDDYGTYKGKVKNEWIDKYNKWLLSKAEEKGLYYLDVETILKGSDGQILAKYDAGDGLHYRSSAYNDIIDYIIHHPVPGVSDDGEFIVHYVPPSGDFKKIMKETPALPANAVTETTTPSPTPTPVKVCEHEYGKWVVEREATETSTGLRYRICDLCGHKDEEILPLVEPKVTPKVTPKPTATPTPTPEPSEEPTPTPTPEPEPVDEPTPEPTEAPADPTPEITEEPTPEPEPDNPEPAEPDSSNE